MKNKLKLAFVLSAVLTTLIITSCADSEITTIDSSYGGIAFFVETNSAQTDSLSYSFAYNKTKLERDTIFLNMRLTGESKPYDREINVSATNQSTAVEGVHFILPKIVLPARAITVKYPLVLLNTADMLTKDFKVVLKVNPSKDLKVGALGREIGTTTAQNGTIVTETTTINKEIYTVKFNNKLTEPNYWTDIQRYGYGKFSITKLQFMLQILGSEKLAVAPTWNYNQTQSYLVQMQNALDIYEKGNGPMIDENGNQVIFDF